MEEGLTATPILCGAVLGACAAGHDWALALRILGNMQHYCVAPDPLALSSTSMSLEMAGQFELRQQFTIVLHSHIAAWLCGIHPQISSAPTSLTDAPARDPTDYDALTSFALELIQTAGTFIAVETICRRRLLDRLWYNFLALRGTFGDISLRGKNEDEACRVALQRPFSLGRSLTAETLQRLEMVSDRQCLREAVSARRILATAVIEAALLAGRPHALRCSSTAGGSWGVGASEREIPSWLSFTLWLKHRKEKPTLDTAGILVGYGGFEIEAPMQTESQ